jgi:hypothetical protein
MSIEFLAASLAVRLLRARQRKRAQASSPIGPNPTPAAAARTHEPPQEQRVRTPAKIIISACFAIIAVSLMLAALGASQPARNQQTAPGRPAYCADKASTYRLPECGASAAEIQQMDTNPRSGSDGQDFARWADWQHHKTCRKKAKNMTVGEIESCL